MTITAAITAGQPTTQGRIAFLTTPPAPLDPATVVAREALFASDLQPSDLPGRDLLADAVTATLRRFGVRGCAAIVAGEFAEHPETAVNRMSWALAHARMIG